MTPTAINLWGADAGNETPDMSDELWEGDIIRIVCKYGSWQVTNVPYRIVMDGSIIQEGNLLPTGNTDSVASAPMSLSGGLYVIEFELNAAREVWEENWNDNYMAKTIIVSRAVSPAAISSISMTGSLCRISMTNLLAGVTNRIQIRNDDLSEGQWSDMASFVSPCRTNASIFSFGNTNSARFFRLRR